MDKLREKSKMLPNNEKFGIEAEIQAKPFTKITQCNAPPELLDDSVPQSSGVYQFQSAVFEGEISVGQHLSCKGTVQQKTIMYRGKVAETADPTNVELRF